MVKYIKILKRVIEFAGWKNILSPAHGAVDFNKVYKIFRPYAHEVYTTYSDLKVNGEFLLCVGVAP